MAENIKVSITLTLGEGQGAKVVTNDVPVSLVVESLNNLIRSLEQQIVREAEKEVHDNEVEDYIQGILAFDRLKLDQIIKNKIIEYDLPLYSRKELLDFATQQTEALQKELETVNITLSRVVKDRREIKEELAEKQIEIDDLRVSVFIYQEGVIENVKQYQKLKAKSDKLFSEFSAIMNEGPFSDEIRTLFDRGEQALKDYEKP